MKKKILGLIPTRLNSTRLPQKALLEIKNIPLVVHTFKRSKLSKLIDELYICCDDKKIFEQMREGRLDCVHVTIAYHENFRETISNIENWNSYFSEHSHLITHAHNVEDIIKAKSKGRTAIIFGFW